jgi:hypothetical protein
VDNVVGLEGVRAGVAMLQTPDGHGRLELMKFHTRRHVAATNTPAEHLRYSPHRLCRRRHRRRRIAFAVDDIDAAVAGLHARGAELLAKVERYEDSYRLCYVRGPEGIIVMLAEQLG